LCENCKEAYRSNESERVRLGIPEGEMIYRAVGCDQCHHSGYRGRAGLYEIITVDDQMRQMIHEGAGEQAMLKHVRTFSKSIDQCGRDKVLDGETSVEEVLRVTAVS